MEAAEKEVVATEEVAMEAAMVVEAKVAGLPVHLAAASDAAAEMEVETQDGASPQAEAQQTERAEVSSLVEVATTDADDGMCVENFDAESDVEGAEEYEMDVGADEETEALEEAPVEASTADACQQKEALGIHRRRVQNRRTMQT